MTLADLLSGLPALVIDGRAHLRGQGRPTSVSTVRSDGSLNTLVSRALASDPVPVAIVSPDGRAIVLTSGESGVIWTQGDPSPEQTARVEEISNALASLGGLSMTGVMSPVTTSRKRRRVVEPEPEVTIKSPEIASEEDQTWVASTPDMTEMPQADEQDWNAS